MVASAASLPTVVVYLLLVLLETLGGGFAADVYVEGVPSYSVTVATDDTRGGLYLVAGTPLGTEERASEATGEQEQIPVVRVEESELVGHQYLVHTTDSPLPFVFDLGPVLRELAVVDPAEVLAISVAGDDALVSGGVELALGDTLYMARRGGFRVLSDPASGIVILVAEE
jgi:hypothetical protein